ncbi:Protein N-acetyltransferase, RimJ/RimL family [Aliiroseovarius halocynthiae]|uniref:GNAT family N-acetyltransferase n=1 Tax=Aliiroseovarius halocynthiae TaxID=985055 RepID=A0A545SSJ2_9RHOB|nr:GNAT family protein [Aliiroseovarius halocynthiae]TQV67938.1 GNAT family N-acetyltransferase [Aliiroseovarius halocynthiae]SMR73040.1 Protein N-acetyltransferase, RimJ/RimL family [Aliiroseovarius halocynthiae]
MWPAPVTLTGDHVKLAPLSADHAPALKEASKDGELHRLWYTSVPTPEGMEDEIARRLDLQNAGSMLPFCVMTPDGTPVGMTTFMNIDAANKRVEIGSTWYRSSVQRSPLNTEAKRLLLAHAFEDLHCNAVEFRTHFMNHQSRAAIERLGAKLDGVLRSHMDQGNGVLRDTAVYSIIASEWPAVRANLTWRLEKPRK